MFLGSADLMQRNLDRRVETAFPLREKRHRDKVRRLLDLQLADNTNGWNLKTDGEFELRNPNGDEDPVDSHAILLTEGF